MLSSTNLVPGTDDTKDEFTSNFNLVVQEDVICEHFSYGKYQLNGPIHNPLFFLKKNEICVYCSIICLEIILSYFKSIDKLNHVDPN